MYVKQCFRLRTQTLIMAFFVAVFMLAFTFTASANTTPNSPSWTKDLIIYQLRLDMFTPEGTLDAAALKLPHLQDLGITAIWLSPIFQATSRPYKETTNNFQVKEPFTLDTRFGTSQDLIDFVNDAHSRGIKVIQDIVVHGVALDSTLISAHNNWFQHDSQGNLILQWGDMPQFDWNNTDLRTWYINGCRDWVTTYGIDGYRCDLEPHITLYSLWNSVRTACNNAGKEVVIFAEDNAERNNTYDFDEAGVGDRHATQGSGDFLIQNNIVDVVKRGSTLVQSGAERFYTFCMSNHDSTSYGVHGSRLKMGYDMIFSPFMPVMFAGEEFNNTGSPIRDEILFYNPIDWSQKNITANANFYNDVKKMISVRKANSDIYSVYPDDFRENNIIKMGTSGTELQSYATYNGTGKAIVIAGNNGGAASWTANSGNWKVEHGQYSQDNTSIWGANSVITGRTWGDVTVDADMYTQLDPDMAYKNDSFGNMYVTHWAGIQVRKANPGDNHTQSGYSVLWRGTGEVLLLKSGTQAASYTPAVSDYRPGPRAFQHIKVAASGNNIKVYLRNESTAVIDYTDNNNPYTSGYVGLVSGQVHAHFDNVKVNTTSFNDDFTGSSRNVTLSVPLAAMNMDGYSSYNVTDVMTDTVTSGITASQLENYSVTVAGDNFKGLKIEGVGTKSQNFSEGFSSGSGNWTANSGTWAVESGEYSQSNTGGWGYNSVVNGRTLDNMTIQADIQIVNNGGNPANWAGIQIRKTNAGDNHETSGYSILFGQNGDVTLYRPGTQLAYASTGLSFATKQMVKVVANGSNIRVYVPNKIAPVIDYYDTTYKGGYYGLVTGCTHAHFDNISVTAMPFKDEFTKGVGNWTANSGTWEPEYGEYSQSDISTYGYNAVITNKTWGNATYEFDMQTIDYGSNIGNWAGITIRKSNPAHNHTGSGYQVVWGANGQVLLLKAGVQVQSANTSYDFTKARHVKVVANGTNIKVYVEYGISPIIDYTDSTYSNGYAGFVTGATHTHFDNLVIY